MNNTPGNGQTFFFVHIMKTAGMSFNKHIQNNFPRETIYPGAADATGVDYWVINKLAEAAVAQRDEIKLWHGHFPFFVTEFVPDAITLSVLREPVARIVSLIDQHRRLNTTDKTIEEIYEDPTVFPRTIHEHQTKMFAMPNGAGINAWTQPYPIDDEAFAAAKERLATVDLLGFQEDFDTFLGQLETRWNWRIEPVERVNSAEERPVISAAFRERIINDNPYDMAFYEFARSNL